MVTRRAEVVARIECGDEIDFVLQYEFVADYLERRGQFRDEHLRKAWASSESGQLFLGGAFANPADSAMLIFKSDTAAVAEAFAATDPYVINGLVKHWRVREWITVVGEHAATPVRPSISS